MKRKHLIWLISIWTTLTISSFVWNYALVISNNRKVILNKSQAFFEQILTARAWNSSHGGVYVPVDANTPSNPYLKDSLKDIVTINGMKLTKLNPAYMTRQIAEINKKIYDIQFHITSLNPIRPANGADGWEIKALKSFEAGALEVMELVKDDSGSTYRYMAPLITENSCLNCHSFQGYKVGNVRGGISISFPAEVYSSGVVRQLVPLFIIHLVILILGIVGLLMFYRMSTNYYSIVEKKNEELKQINATKDKLFSIIAHDLKAPFSIILGSAYLLKERYDRLDETKRLRFVDEISTSAKTVSELLSNTLLWARSQRDKIVIVKIDFNLGEMVMDSIAGYRSIAHNKNITYNIRIEESIMVHADYFTVKTIISNLFSNAIKFTPRTGNILIEAIRNESGVEISIADTGVGIPLDIIPTLFRVSSTYSTKGTNNESGTGLGLPICKELIEKNGGTIRVESELGKGSKFIIFLPEV